MHVEVLLVPYDSGHRGLRMGRGPLHLMERGLDDALREAGHQVTTTLLECALDPPSEIAVAFDLARSIAAAVRTARDTGRFPLILSGNCIASLGIVAGLGPDGTGVLWLDAHADFNTPETTRSGLLDGMAAATLTGRCWRDLAASVPGFRPIDDRRFILIGARDLDPAEESLLREAELAVVRPAAVRERGARDAVAPAVARAVEQGLEGFYLHVDLDVVDPSVARANGYAAPGGLTIAQVVAVAALAADAARLTAAAIAAFDPDFDEDGRGSGAATEIALGILRQAR